MQIGSAQPPASGIESGGKSPDTRLVDLSKIIADESGRYSRRDKIDAKADLQHLFETNIFDYSLEDRKFYAQAWENSSFAKEYYAAGKKYEAALQANSSGAGKTSEHIQAIITARSQLTEDERLMLTDFKGQDEFLQAQRDLFRQLEEREAAGAFKWGTPLEQVADPQSRIALELLRDIDKVFANRRPTSEKAQNLKPVLDRIGSYFGAAGDGSGGRNWQDKVDLSPEARQFLAQGQR